MERAMFARGKPGENAEGSQMYRVYCVWYDGRRELKGTWDSYNAAVVDRANYNSQFSWGEIVRV